MEQGKKTLNTLGILVSVLLSIVLVLFLAVTPLTMSVLSLLHPDTLADAVSKVDFESTIGAIVEESGEVMESQQIKQLGAILSTNAAKDLIKTYTQNVIDALGGKADVQGITVEMLQRFVSENKEELVQALRKSGGEFAAMSDQALMEDIQRAVDENAQEIVDMLPDPQQLRQELIGENPQMELAVVLVAAVNTIKLILVGVAVVLCLLIFFCRFVDLRGIKWLGIDLLIAGLFSAVVSGSFNLIHKLLVGLAEGSAWASGLVDAFVGSVNTGVIVRTVIVLVAAIGLLVGYLLICKHKQKKAAPVAEKLAEIAETTEPNT